MNRVSPWVVAMLGISTATAADAPRTPKVWAIVAGVDAYADGQIPRCSGAVRDAREVASWFTGQAGWDRKNVLRLDDFGRRSHGAAIEPSEALRPTLANLEWAVVDWLGARAGPGDVVVFYFAGQATGKAGRAGGPARSYLLPIDAALADVERTGFALDEALDRSGMARKAKVVIWLDTAPQGRGKLGIAPEKGAPSGFDWLRALTRWQGVTAWLAADGSPAPEAGTPGPFVASLERAMGTPERAHNLLGCLEGLRGDSALVARGFKTQGGVGPAVSLWKAAVRPIEDAVPELVVQSGHGDRVTSTLVTADGSTLISAAKDSTVRVWRLADRSLARTLAESLGGIEAIAMNRDGTTLAAGDGLGRIIGWDMALDRPRRLYGPTGHDRGIHALAFLPDGRRFVSLGKGRDSFLWDSGGGVLAKIGVFSAEKITRIAAASRPEAGAPALVAAAEAVEGGPSHLLAFDADGKRLFRLEGTGARVASLDLSADGRLLAAGDVRGRAVLIDLASREPIHDRASGDPIRLVRLSATGLLFVADGRAARLVEPRPGGREATLADPRGGAIPGEVDRAEFSADGRWLAACSAVEGRTFAWRLTDPARPAAVAIPDEGGRAISPAFTPDGRVLVVGDADGGLRSWTLEVGPEGPRAEPRPSIRPARGKVAELAPSASGRYLLEVTKDDLALIWDLKEGRGVRPLPGSYLSGAFLADESMVALATRPDAGDRGGDVVLVDRAGGKVLPLAFERPKGADGRPSKVSFGKVAASRSGRLVAGASLEAERPLACVWRADTGAIAHLVREPGGGLTAIDLSPDGAFLLTASEDGAARLWPLGGGGEVELRRPATAFVSPGEASEAVSAARFGPGIGARRVATGTRAGYVFLWEWAEKGGRRARVDVGKLDGEINALAFSPDGKWLAASASRERVVRFWSLAEGLAPRAVAFTPQVHHAEQVGALAAWPDGSILVSGGDDAAVRFWDLKEKALAGTLLAEARGLTSVDWLAYTPEGLFDGSQPGEAMLKWRVGDRMVALEQSEDTHHHFQLAAKLTGPAAGRPRLPARAEDPPELKIVDPPAVRTAGGREVELTLWFGDRDLDLKGLRLYQNGVPVRGGDDDFAADRPHFARTRVQLRKGDNRLYAMASRPGSSDGKSDEVTLRYDGPEAPGRLHTIAIAIGNYAGRALKYAQIDARDMAGFLHDRGLKGVDRPGERIVLTDDDVNPQAIDDAFRKLRAAVSGHPEDTVVLFLAGHTDTDDKNDQFCLLLPRFPFDGSPPLTPGDVALRGNTGGTRALVGDPNVLPYVVLYNRLAHLDALQRLVIVDACQAGAILDDPAVRNIRRLVDRGSRKARNSYLLAARRGEPATEADALAHGLLTYALLRGMGASDLKAIPEDLGGFPGPPTADSDRDGVISTDELVAFADDTLPRLTRMFPQVVLRAGAGRTPPGPGDRPEPGPELEQKLRLQSAEASFPLVLLPPLPK